jgi:hypothetical protein
VAKTSPWKKLAAELIENGIESQYLARISTRVTAEERLESVEHEIAQEMAGALGRSEDRVNLALAELELAKARYDRAPPAERNALARAYNQHRTAAQARVRELLIHREAVGFRRNHILAELYPIPPRLAEDVEPTE